MSSYDTWLSDPYEQHYYEAEKERREKEEHLENISVLETEEEIEEFLQQIGMTLDELELAEEMFGMGEGALGFTI